MFNASFFGNFNSYEIANVLIENGLSVEKKTKDGLTPLHFVFILNKSVEVGKLLIERGANIEEKDNDGITSLQLSGPDTLIRSILEDLTNK